MITVFSYYNSIQLLQQFVNTNVAVVIGQEGSIKIMLDTFLFFGGGMCGKQKTNIPGNYGENNR